jgi:F0F1-type ATP synthase delta subunit
MIKIMDRFDKEYYINLLDLLSDNERFEIFSEYCLGCGSHKPCYCMKDD